MRNAPEGIIGTKPDQTAGLGLFAEAEALGLIDTRSVPAVAMPGASQAAREAIAPHLSRLEAQTLAGIVSYGPITRDALAETLGMNPNTLRPRVKALLDRKLVQVVGYTGDSPRRELLAVAPTPPATPEPETDR